jgi:tetratricopeptide (TPR) repeat protein
MKKTILTIFLLLIIAVTGCSNSDEWQQDISGMPEEQKTKHIETLEEHLAIIKEEPNNIESQFEVAFQYHQLGEYRNAEEAYKRTLELDPVHIVALNNLAAIYEEVEEYDYASLYIRKLFEIQPTTPEVIRDTVRILLKADDPENAQLALESFLSLTKDLDSPELKKIGSDLFQSIVDYRSGL